MDWPSLVGASGGVLLTIGGGIKYLISRSDKKTDAVQGILQMQISTMQKTVDGLTKVLERYRVENLSLTRHVGVLEGMLRSKGIAVPPLEVVAPAPVSTPADGTGDDANTI